jgi:hypothetical protein
MFGWLLKIISHAYQGGYLKHIVIVFKYLTNNQFKKKSLFKGVS